MSVINYLPLRISPISVAIACMHTLFLVFLHQKSLFLFEWQILSITAVLGSYAATLLSGQIIDATWSIDRRWGRILYWSYFLLYGLLAAYLFSATTSFDYAVLADNLHSAFSREAFGVITGRLKLDPILVALVIAMTSSVLARKKKIQFGIQTIRAKEKALSAIAIYAFLLILPLPSLDEPSNFLRSIRFYYSNPYAYTPSKNSPEYPFLRAKQSATTKVSQKPNIIFLMVESFNGTYIGKTTEDGRPITPVFNALTKRGLHIPEFYGSSVQTSKGKFAIFTSLIPSIRGIAFRDYESINVKTLPEILKENGYATFHIKASSITNFDNEQTFLRKNGYDQFVSVTEALKPEDQPYIWNWGPEDSVFYKRAFEMLDQYRKDSPNTPFFFSMATIGNHTPFEVPEERRFLYKDPKNLHERFANSLYLADQQLQVFFQELRNRGLEKNSIIIVTGDHSFPTQKNRSNETSFHNEAFRVPFVMLWDKHVQKTAVKRASQLDIAPTLLAATGLAHVSHHFTGQNLLTEDLKPSPIFLIQPYNGIYISVILGPYKYVKRLRTGEERVYDLERDPEETTNIMGTLSPETLDQLRTHLKVVFQNQYLLSRDKIWPQ